jgi:membrane protein insertase Oxa1/YidC/SpoIIIJ
MYRWSQAALSVPRLHVAPLALGKKVMAIRSVCSRSTVKPFEQRRATSVMQRTSMQLSLQLRPSFAAVAKPPTSSCQSCSVRAWWNESTRPPAFVAAAASSAATAAKDSATTVGDVTAAAQAQLNQALVDSVASSPILQDEPFWVTRQAMELLVSLHDVSHSPWWATIISAAVLVRVLFIPSSIYSARLLATLSGLEGHFLSIQQLVGKSPQTPAKKAFIGMKLMGGLMGKYKCNPLRTLPGAFLQIGALVTLGAAIRRLLPSTPQMKTEGFAWVSDLTLPDEHWILPVTIWGGSYLLTFVVSKYHETKALAKREKMMAAGNAIQKKENEVARLNQTIAPGNATWGSSAAAGGEASPSSPSSPKATSTLPSQTSESTVTIAAMSNVRSALTNFGHCVRGATLFSILVLPYMPSGVLLLWFTSVFWQGGWHALIRNESVRGKMGLVERERMFEVLAAQAMLERKKFMDSYVENAALAASAAKKPAAPRGLKKRVYIEVSSPAVQPIAQSESLDSTGRSKPLQSIDPLNAIDPLELLNPGKTEPQPSNPELKV